jgi:hypothetical protein
MSEPNTVTCDEAAIRALSKTGAALVACQGQTSEQWATSIENLMQPIARQIRVFGDRPKWRAIGVDTAKDADRSEGTGESPLHMDFVNAEFPPDYVVLLCVRTDPLAGGQSTLASLAAATSRMSQDERKHLEFRQFVDGKVDGLLNVGRDINPFAILSPNDNFKFRFTAQLLKQRYLAETEAALRHFHAELESQKSVFLVPSGHALIIDQHWHVHGKVGLGEGQEALPTAHRRLLLHGFFRSIQ